MSRVQRNRLFEIWERTCATWPGREKLHLRHLKCLIIILKTSACLEETAHACRLVYASVVLIRLRKVSYYRGSFMKYKSVLFRSFFRDFNNEFSRTRRGNTCSQDGFPSRHFEISLETSLSIKDRMQMIFKLPI